MHVSDFKWELPADTDSDLAGNNCNNSNSKFELSSDSRNSTNVFVGKNVRNWTCWEKTCCV
jgi:hypothetical protein